MITYEEALQIVLNHTYEFGSESVSLQESTGRVLAEDVFSDINMPPFNRSAVDGFACRKEDILQLLEVVETVRAGVFPAKRIGPGQCTRIMTGAPVPEGADCVIMAEETTELTSDSIRFTGDQTKTNISPFAQDIREGERVLASGTLIGPQHIAIMAAVGYINPRVAAKPKVSVISTGDEIVEIVKWSNAPEPVVTLSFPVPVVTVKCVSSLKVALELVEPQVPALWSTPPNVMALTVLKLPLA